MGHEIWFLLNFSCSPWRQAAAEAAAGDKAVAEDIPLAVEAARVRAEWAEWEAAEGRPQRAGPLCLIFWTSRDYDPYE